MMTFLNLIGLLLLAGIFLWAIKQFPIDAEVVKLIKVVIIVVLAIWVLAALGFLPDAPLPHLHKW